MLKRLGLVAAMNVALVPTALQTAAHAATYT
jgi:hypothetical protein